MESLKLDESCLRVFQHCPNSYTLGVRSELNLQTRILRNTFEAHFYDVLYSMDTGIEPQGLHNILARTTYNLCRGTHSPPEIRDLNNALIFVLEDLAKILPLSSWQIVAPAIDLRVQISKSDYNVHISGLFHLGNRSALRTIVFAPYSTKLDAYNDLALVPIFLTMSKNIFVEANTAPKANQIHIINVSKYNKLYHHQINSSSVKPYTKKWLKQTIQAIESGYSIPKLPCTSPCSAAANCAAMR